MAPKNQATSNYLKRSVGVGADDASLDEYSIGKRARLDTNGDEEVSAIDALRVINQLQKTPAALATSERVDVAIESLADELEEEMEWGLPSLF